MQKLPLSQTYSSFAGTITGNQPQYQITTDDRDRQKRICDAWAAYKGQLDAPLMKMPGQPDDNVLNNQCKAIVDRGTEFLFGKELEISVGTDAPPESQNCLNKIWGRKETRIPLLQKLAMSGSICGQAFLRIVPSSTTIRLVVVDPSTVFVRTAPQDCETVLLYCIEYSSTETINGRLVECYYREEITRIDPSSDDDVEGYEDLDSNGFDAGVTWQIQHWTRQGDRGVWSQVSDPILWQYPFPPLFHCQNLPNPHEFWGIPDLTPDLIGVNNALNLVQSNINRINKLYGQPILYAVGAGEQVIDVKPGRIITLGGVNSGIHAVPIQADIQGASLFADTLRSNIDEQSGVPSIAIGRIKDIPRGSISGIAIELMFMPLLKKTDKKRCLYGEIILDVSLALLSISGIQGDIDLTLGWQDPLPHDDLPAINAEVAKKQLGISNTTLQRELGYDPLEEAALAEEENQSESIPEDVQMQAESEDDAQQE